MNFADIFLATDLANERRRQAQRHSLAVRVAIASRATDGGPSLRRLTARGLAQISRSSAAAVRRLDDRIADDLTTRLAGGRHLRPHA
jgi:hypothetical protein